jgi:hypothetical protein
MNMAKILLDNGFKLYEDFFPGAMPPGRLIIVNNKKFKGLPRYVKQKFEQDFDISQCTAAQL